MSICRNNAGNARHHHQIVAKRCLAARPFIRLPQSSTLWRAAAFSRKELLATVACVAFLACIAVVCCSQYRDWPARKGCQQNIRALLAGFNAFAVDADQLPASARIGMPAEDDWVYFQPERLLGQSAIAQYTTNFLSMLRCPADNKFAFRGYPYSYSMNINLEETSMQVIPGHVQLVLLYEEEAPNDGAFAVGGPADVLAKRHTGRSNTGFLDGHVERLEQNRAITQSRPSL